MKPGMYIMASEPIWTAYFINTSHQSICLYVYVARLGYRCNEYTTNNRRIVGCVVFYAIHVVSKESLWVSVYSLSLLGNGSVNTFQRQRGIVADIVFDASMSFQRKVCNLFFPELLVTKSVVIFPSSTCEACSGFISVFYMFFSIFPYGCYVLWSSESITYGMALIQPLSELGKWWTQNTSDHQISASKVENGDLSIIRNMFGESAIQYLFSPSRNAPPHQPL
jgi:hypothetical protein